MKQFLNNAYDNQGFSLNTIPYRGEPTVVKKDARGEERPQLIKDTFVKVFDLSDESDLKALQKALRKATNGRAFVHKLESKYDDKKQNWKVLTIYSELYYEKAEQVQKKILEL